MSYQTLQVEHRDGIVTVMVNRPKLLNALSTLVLTELAAVFTDLQSVDGFLIRGVVLTGTGGRAFVAGADIAEMAAMSADQGEEFGALGQLVTTLIEELPLPVIAGVDGYALGGGCELAMACDYIYATETAIFGQPEVRLGLIPGFGGCVRLPRLIGPNRARELIYTGRRVNAAEAVRIGLVNQVFADRASMLAAAEESIALIAEQSPIAVSMSKAAINDSAGCTTKRALEIEKAAFRQAFSSQDMREGTRAFIAKRSPNFPAR